MSAKDLLKHEFLVKNVKQFQPMDVRKVPGTVNGGMINLNSNANANNNQNLTQTVWDIFNNPGIYNQQQPSRNMQNMGIPIQQPIPQMQIPGQQVYMVPHQQKYMMPGGMQMGGYV